LTLTDAFEGTPVPFKSDLIGLVWQGENDLCRMPRVKAQPPTTNIGKILIRPPLQVCRRSRFTPILCL